MGSDDSMQQDLHSEQLGSKEQIEPEPRFLNFRGEEEGGSRMVENNLTRD